MEGTESTETSLERPAQDRGDLPIFLSGTTKVMAGTAFKILAVILTQVIAARILLPERYGLITWGLFLVNIVSMLTGFGLKTAIPRFLAVHLARGDQASVRGIIIACSLLTTAGGVVGCILLSSSAEWLARHVMGDEREAAILLTFALVVPLWNVQMAMLGVFGGFKLPVLKVLIEDTLVPGGFLLVVLGAWVAGWDEVAIARGYVVVYLVGAVLSVALVRLKTSYSRIRDIRPAYHTAQVLRFSWPLVITEPMAKFVGLVDILIIGALAASYDVGIYRSASELAAAMSVVLLVFGFMYLPIVSTFSASGAHSQWNDISARTARWSMVLGLPIFSTFFFFPDEVIRTVYGPAYGQAAPVLRILAMAHFGNAMVGFTGTNLVAAGMTRTQLAGHAASFMISVGASWLLIPIIGIQGAAVASLLGLWSVNGLFLIVMKLRLDLQPFTRLYLQTLAIFLLLAAAGSFLLRLATFLPDIVSIILFVLMCIGFLGLLYRLHYLFDATDHALIRSALRRWIPLSHENEAVLNA